MSRPIAEHELSRILALVPWIVAHPGTAKTEVAQRFGISIEDLESDLDLVLMIGIPPYSPAEYIDVDAEGDAVTIRLADYFRRPLRLDPAEGLALLAAGRALLAVPGSDPTGPLATALTKLEAALDLPDLVVSIDAPAFLDDVRAAADHDERIEIDYWSAGRDELTTRRIDPLTVFFALGAWYVDAWCHRADAERLFRVDRIRAVRPTGERFEPNGPGLSPVDVYRPRADDPRVTLSLPATAQWVAESYPAELVEETDDGRIRIRLAVSEPAWLARLLLQVGPDARVEEPEALRAVAQDAAARVAARYRAT
ncbi:MAG TPA: WYL domain-containing protein [Acidimicrobiia bacterium]|jgi:proteasome accessory factor C|nr:WYL domain-containing protein [Acidimicrobiia bacterium]